MGEKKLFTMSCHLKCLFHLSVTFLLSLLQLVVKLWILSVFSLTNFVSMNNKCSLYFLLHTTLFHDKYFLGLNVDRTSNVIYSGKRCLEHKMLSISSITENYSKWFKLKQSLPLITVHSEGCFTSSETKEKVHNFLTVFWNNRILITCQFEIQSCFTWICSM